MKISKELSDFMKERNTFDSFREEYARIHTRSPAYANTLVGMLEIARDLESKKSPYLIIGGLAIASYLHQVDHNAFENWRGTSDVDLVVPDRKIAEQVLHNNSYEFKQTIKNKPGVYGLLYDYVKEDNGESTVVGFRQGIVDKTGKDVTQKFINHATRISVHEVRVSVPQLRNLSDMKKWANRAKDRQDRKTIRDLFSKF